MVTETGKIFILQKSIVDNNVSLKLDVNYLDSAAGTKTNTVGYATPSAIGGGTVTTNIVGTELFTFDDTSPVTTAILTTQLRYDSTTDIVLATETLVNQSLLYGGTLEYSAFTIGLT